MKPQITFFLFFISFGLFAQNQEEEKLVNASQSNAPSFFQAIQGAPLDLDMDWIVPQKFVTYEVDESALLSYLDNVPMEFIGKDQEKSIRLPFPNDKGYMSFTIVESPIMEPELVEEFPMIKTYRGQGIEDPTATMRMDFTIKGFHAIIKSQDGTVYLDPYSRQKTPYYIAYFKHDFTTEKEFVCNHVPNAEDLKSDHQHNDLNRSSMSGLNTYRIAIAATGEYTTFYSNPNPPSVAAGLSGIVTTLARVNLIYERDFNIRLILVGNNSSIVFTNASTDPYSNTSNYYTENQTTLDNIIGDSNYDIGHVFNAAGNNGAAPGDVCVSGDKAKAFTQSTTPQGDPFDVDYVAHEFGHQFSGAHSFNNSCGGQNWNDPHSIEPGSGSTIMGYAGICAPNVQSLSDDYFHGMSIERIGNYVSTGTGNSCKGLITNSNTKPTFNQDPVGKTIPADTPFFLHTSGSDAEGDALTYGIEQIDGELLGGVVPSSTNTNGPAFRSFDPIADTTTYFPRIREVFKNASPTWEVLSSVTRTYEFMYTIRDNNSAGGLTEQKKATINVDASAGPFEITSPSSGASFTGHNFYSIQWNVAGTNTGAVDCDFVDIYMYPDTSSNVRFLLAEMTPNDGSEIVQMANFNSTKARIAVVGHDHYFYDVNDADIAVSLSGDLCDEALEVLCGNSYSVNTTGATDTGTPACSNQHEGIWYKITGTGNDITVSTCGLSNEDTVLEIFDGPCTALDCYDYNDDFCNLQSEITFSSNQGEIYFIYIRGISGAAINTGFSISCQAPTNDLMANAIEINCDMSTISGATLAATETGEPADCNTVTDAPGVWYTMDGVGADITLDLCGNTSYDSKLSIYEDDGSGGLICVDGEDDDSSCVNNDPTITFSSEIGKTYFIYVHGYNGQTGGFDLDISCACSTVVINTDDSGYGSFRDVIDCSPAGSTITFDPSIDGMPINISSDNIFINKALTIQGNGIGNTIINGSTLDDFNLFFISNSDDVSIQNLSIEDLSTQNSNTPGSVIRKVGDGTLNIQSVLFDQNHTNYYIIDQSDGVMNIVNSIFKNNFEAANTGECIIYRQNVSQAYIHQNVFYDNNTDFAYIGFDEYVEFISNTIVDLDIRIRNTGAYEIHNNIIQTNSSNPLNIDPGTSGSATHNISLVVDPDLASADGNLVGDALFTNPTNEDYSLQNTSLAIGTGDNNSLPADILNVDNDGDTTEDLPLDFLGNTRIEGCNLKVDMGAIENQNSNSTLLVSTTNDSGYGSLRYVIECAAPGSTITFDSSIDGMPIMLSSGQILIDKDLIFGGNGVENTIIDGSMLNDNVRMFTTGNQEIEFSYIEFRNGGSATSTITGTVISTFGSHKTTFKYCNFDQNKNISSGGIGGALLNTNGELILSHCNFTGNVSGTGSVLYSQIGGTNHVINCVFQGNSIGQTGILFMDSSDLFVNHSTFANNSLVGSTGDIVYNLESDVTIYNSIFFNGINILNNQGNSTIGASHNYYDIPLDLPTTNSFQGDPMFMDLIGGDLRLSSSSQAVDGGNNILMSLDVGDIDFDGDISDEIEIDFQIDLEVPRIVGGTIDMGAFEYVQEVCDAYQIDCGDQITFNFDEDFAYFSCSQDVYNSKVVKYNPTADATININTTTPNKVIEIYIWTGVCDGGVCADIDNETIDIDNPFEYEFTGGEEYIIELYNDDNLTGTADINFDCVYDCANDIVLSSPTDDISGSTVILETDQSVIATNVISGGAVVEYDGALSVDLNAGFEVGIGVEFHAYNDGCGVPATLKETEDYNMKLQKPRRKKSIFNQRFKK